MNPAFSEKMVVAALALLVVYLLIYLYLLAASRRRSALPPLRAIAAYTRLDNAVARAAELGKGIHISPGAGGIESGSHPAETLAGLTAMEHVARQTALSGANLIATAGEGATYTLADNVVARGYAAVGRSADYQPTTTRFVSQSQSNTLPYSVGAADVIEHEGVEASVTIGAFGPDYLLVGEAGHRQGVEQVVGATNPQALTTMVLANPLGQVLIGEEIFAAGAYLQGRTSHRASLVAQDAIRILLILLIIGGAVLATVSPQLLQDLLK